MEYFMLRVLHLQEKDRQYCLKGKVELIPIALGYGLDDRGSRFNSQRELGIFPFTAASKTALVPTQPPIQWVPGALSLGSKKARVWN